ncbi:MAG: alpha/beta fold hydrolase [Streptosporangiaceae bacterium]
MDFEVAVDGGLIWGEDSGGAGPAILLAHSGLSDHRLWDAIWPALTSHARVIRYDARGYGRSSPPATAYRQTDDMLRVLDDRRLGAAHLVGCSMGGATAIDLALAQPDRVASLTLLCPGLSGYPWPEEPEVDADYQAAEASGDPDAIAAIAIREWAAAGTDPLITEMLLGAIRAWPAEEQHCLEPEDPAYGRLGAVRAPTVLLVGDLDRPALIACDEAIAAGIPGCELIRLPRVDHYRSLREPEAVTSAVMSQCGLGGPGRARARDFAFLRVSPPIAICPLWRHLPDTMLRS